MEHFHYLMDNKLKKEREDIDENLADIHKK